jgi:hypothetical protein
MAPTIARGIAMRTARIALLTLGAALLGACSQPEPTAFVPGQAMVFPMRSDGTLEDVGARLIKDCRDKGDVNNPDCALRIKNRLEQCIGQVPGVFQTEAIYRKYTGDYEKCLTKR